MKKELGPKIIISLFLPWTWAKILSYLFPVWELSFLSNIYDRFDLVVIPLMYLFLWINAWFPNSCHSTWNYKKLLSVSRMKRGELQVTVLQNGKLISNIISWINWKFSSSISCTDLYLNFKLKIFRCCLAWLYQAFLINWLYSTYSILGS
jgi:hypothetical protein